MTTLLPDVRLVSPEPTVLWHPTEVLSSSGAEAVELAAAAGLVLDPWQQLVLDHGLAEKRGGKWAAFEVGVCMARQNGKGAIIEARELAGLFLLGERLIVHTAHLFDTALEAFRRVLELIESTPDLDSRVKRVSRSHGEEGVELKSGQRLKFKARTKGGGRGFSGDCVILDEAMNLPEPAIRALMFTLSARPNPQLWYLGSAVDKHIDEHGEVFSKLRARGVAGGDESLVWAEWSAPLGSDADDPRVWAAANPRMSLEQIARERRSMSDRGFRVERLSQGDWYTDEDSADDVAFDLDRWRAAGVDPKAPRGPEPSFGVAVAPDRSWSAIGVAWRRPDGRTQVMVSAGDYRPGAEWVGPRVAELRSRWGAPVVTNTAGKGLAAGAVTPPEGEQNIAANALADLLKADGLRHGNQGELNTAVRGSRWRTVGNTRALDQKGSTDIMPLVAVALAAHGLRSRGISNYESRGLVTL